MTRSDILLEIARLQNKDPRDEDAMKLVHKLHRKVENIYQLLFVMEKDDTLKELSDFIRKALEE
jgi:hypothetical protein